MKRSTKWIMTILIIPVIVVAGGNGLSNRILAEKGDDKLNVVTTFSVLYDIVRNVGGERIGDIHSIVPLGTDPHEYTPLPLDLKKATDADVLFWNGLDMETGDGWFEQLVTVAHKNIDGPNVFLLSEGVEPLYLTDGKTTEINPHAFIDVTAGIRYTKNARDAFISIDPDHAHIYEKNASSYIAELEKIHQKYADLIAEIPEHRRILVTSERAFQYMAKTYGLREGYIWEIDTDEHGTPMQLLNVISFIKRNNVPVLFVESNVDPRPMETVSKETKVPIFAKLYSDELGASNTPGATYIGYLNWNIDRIYEGLKD